MNIDELEDVVNDNLYHRMKNPYGPAKGMIIDGVAASECVDTKSEYAKHSYEYGGRTKDIAKELGVSSHCVLAALKRAGVQMREPGWPGAKKRDRSVKYV
jgi:hypothetical protein